MPPENLNSLLDTRETAIFLGLAPSTLESWRCRGRGPAYCKLGANVMYRIEDLEVWLDSHRIVPEPVAAKENTMGTCKRG